MYSLNLFKLENDTHNIKLFYNELYNAYTLQGEKEIINLDEKFIFKYFHFNNNCTKEKNCEWDWINQLFNLNVLYKYNQNPRVLIIVLYKDNTYALSFGGSYSLINKYCDTNFAFDFIRKLKLKNIKTSTVVAPLSYRTQSVNVFKNAEDLDINSGEAYLKIKCSIDNSVEEIIFDEKIEVGNSIKFKLLENSFESICKLLRYVINKVDDQTEITRVPIFRKIDDKSKVQILNNNLINHINSNMDKLNIFELQIVGVKEFFRDAIDKYVLLVNRKKLKINDFNLEEISRVLTENNMSLSEEIFRIKIQYYIDNNFFNINLIDTLEVVDDEHNAILFNGKWYLYNDDYLKYLDESINNIDISSNDIFNYSNELYKNFLNEKSTQENLDIKSLEKTYYKELAYNTSLTINQGFTLFDTKKYIIDNHDVEFADLMKDDTLYFVKIGKSSGKLLYTFDQCLISAKLYKDGKIGKEYNIKKFIVILLLDRKNRLPIINGRPDISKLKMLGLKIKIDDCKKQLDKLHYKFELFINYYEDECA